MGPFMASSSEIVPTHETLRSVAIAGLIINGFIATPFPAMQYVHPAGSPPGRRAERTAPGIAAGPERHTVIRNVAYGTAALPTPLQTVCSGRGTRIEGSSPAMRTLPSVQTPDLTNRDGQDPSSQRRSGPAVAKQSDSRRAAPSADRTGVRRQRGRRRRSQAPIRTTRSARSIQPLPLVPPRNPESTMTAMRAHLLTRVLPVKSRFPSGTPFQRRMA
jgi:hypothetical protein